MTNRIYYFTGSGNSLALARTIAERLGDTEVLPMAKHLGGVDGGDAERIGLVFPVYLWGLPRMAAGFVRRLRAGSEQYVFAVASCSGTPGRPLVRLRRLLRSNGSDLAAGFATREDVETFWPGRSDDARTMAFGRMVTRHPPPTAGERTDEIVDTIQRKERRKPETSNPIVTTLLGPMLGRMSTKELKNGDRHFSVGDACTSCGTCARVCPRENVALENGRPVWHHDCETCYACLLWCPEKAIAYAGSLPQEPTHHPDVTLEDMLLR
jgi:ferredoxin